MFRALTAVLIVTALSGCASTIGTFYNRPVVEDKVGEDVRTVSLSADRRTVIVTSLDKPKKLFCAEPPPDTATTIKTDLDTTLKAKGVDVGIKDKFDLTAQILSSRNAPLDAFRTGVFSLCQFYLNGAMDKPEVSRMFEKLLDVFERTQSIVNDQQKPALPAAGASGKNGAGTTAQPAAGAPAMNATVLIEKTR